VRPKRLSHVDGKNASIVGGYQIEDLAGHVGLKKRALLEGRLPDRAELAKLSAQMAELRNCIRCTRCAARRKIRAPIDALRMVCATLSWAEIPMRSRLRLISWRPCADGLFSHRRCGACPPRQGTGTDSAAQESPLAANFLYMLHGKEPDRCRASAGHLLVTVMDHGMNASTFTARVIASTRSDLVSSVTGALGRSKAPCMAALLAVLDMLLEIRTADRAEPWLRNELAQGRRIMGFGHRIYKVRDPRAEVLSRVAERMGKRNSRIASFMNLRACEQTASRVLAEPSPDGPCVQT